MTVSTSQFCFCLVRNPYALFNPDTSVLMQKCDPHTGPLNREMSGDSENALLHCADVYSTAEAETYPEKSILYCEVPGAGRPSMSLKQWPHLSSLGR